MNLSQESEGRASPLSAPPSPPSFPRPPLPRAHVLKAAAPTGGSDSGAASLSATALPSRRHEVTTMK